jgi:hypothetical protein
MIMIPFILLSVLPLVVAAVLAMIYPSQSTSSRNPANW